ncbi:MAG: class I SAM-dependent methyltransferase [Methanobacterium sp.]
MVKKKADNYKEESRESFNKQAESYDSSYYGKHGKKLHNSVFSKLNHISFNSLLDVGCGTGNLLLLISSKYEASFAGVDISPDMLEIARDKLGEKADLIVGDSENLPFDDESFDVVTCTDSFHHYPHPGNVLLEFKRVLKREGHIIIADLSVPQPFRQLGNLLIPFTKDGDVRIYSESEIRKLLDNTGFKGFEWEQISMSAFIVTAFK